MRRKLIAVYVASTLFGSTGLALAHSGMDRDASLPSGAAILNSTTVDESRSLPSESAAVPSEATTLPSDSVSEGADVTVLERYDPESASEGSSLPSAPASVSGVNPSAAMEDSASSESSSSGDSAPRSYSLYPDE